MKKLIVEVYVPKIPYQQSGAAAVSEFLVEIDGEYDQAAESEDGDECDDGLCGHRQGRCGR